MYGPIVANKRSLFCRGLDYVILTPEGVEEHFSEIETKRLDVNELIEIRLKKLSRETANLRRFQERIKEEP